MADTAALSNPLKEMMKAGKVALGMNVRLARSGDIARIAKSSGHDFIFIDRQHAIFTLETIAHIAHTALGCGITPLVRVRSVDDQDVQVLLDNGVMGIVYPDVNTADFRNLRLRDIPSLTIDRFDLGLHILRNTRAETRKWYDNVVAATSYIGPTVKASRRRQLPLGPFGH
jgi:hypothetical protein